MARVACLGAGMSNTDRPVFFISSPYAQKATQQILGYAAYSHKILAEKLIDFLNSSYEIEYVTGENELQASILIRQNLNKNNRYFFLYVGPPEDAWTSSECKNIIIFTWEFPDVPEGSTNSEFNWVSILSKFDLVVTPNTILQPKLNHLGISNVYIPIGSLVVQNSKLKYEEALDILGRTEGVKFENSENSRWLNSNNIELISPFTLRIIEKFREIYFNFYIVKIMPKIIHTKLRDFHRNYVNKYYSNSDRNILNFTPFENLSLEIYGRLVIGSWLNISDARKNFETLIHAYAASAYNRKDIVLLIKIIGDELELIKAQSIIEDINLRMNKSLPPIILLRGALKEEVLDAIRISTDIYLNTSSTEGICLPAIEHSINGVELVIPRNSAFIDYFPDNSVNFYDVDSTPTHFPTDPLKLFSTRWNPPIFKSLVEVLRATIQTYSVQPKKSAFTTNINYHEMKPKDFVNIIVRCLNDRH